MCVLRAGRQKRETRSGAEPERCSNGAGELRNLAWVAMAAMRLASSIAVIPDRRWTARYRVVCCAVSGGTPTEYAYSRVYPRKATWEATFGETNFGNHVQAETRSSPPWQTLGQLNEANLVWHDDLQAQLLKARPSGSQVDEQYLTKCQQG